MSTPPVGPERTASSDDATTAESDEILGREPSRRRLGLAREWRSLAPPRGEIVAALVLAGVAAALGAPLGLLWWALAPQVELIKLDSGVYPTDSEPEGYFADDGWFILLGAGMGVLLGVAAWMLARRHRGPLIALGLVIGSVAGGVLAAWLGHRFGLAGYERLLREAPAGTRLYRPVNLRIADVGLWQGFLPKVRGTPLIPAFAAASMYTLLAAINPWPSLRAEQHVGALADALGAAELSSDSPAPPAPSERSAPPGSATTAPPPDAAAFVRRADD